MEPGAPASWWRSAGGFKTTGARSTQAGRRERSDGGARRRKSGGFGSASRFRFLRAFKTSRADDGLYSLLRRETSAWSALGSYVSSGLDESEPDALSGTDRGTEAARERQKLCPAGDSTRAHDKRALRKPPEANRRRPPRRLLATTHGPLALSSLPPRAPQKGEMVWKRKFLEPTESEPPTPP